VKKLSVPLTFEAPQESRPADYGFQQMKGDVVQWDPVTKTYFTNSGWAMGCSARTTSATETLASEE